MVLGRAAEHGRAADVDVLDGVLEGAVRLRDGGFERVEVHDDEVDELDAVLPCRSCGACGGSRKTWGTPPN